MIDRGVSFYGQQEGERVLYRVIHHPLAKQLRAVKLFFASSAVWLAFAMIDNQINLVQLNISLIGFILALAILLIGLLMFAAMDKKSHAYITDRRIIRFEAASPFATSTRTLTWEEAVKVKTYPPNFLWKSLMAGNVVIHAKSTLVTNQQVESASLATNDDIELNNTYYYKDLGNYIEKIIYTYKREPEKLKNIHPFVPRPKGQRY